MDEQRLKTFLASQGYMVLAVTLDDGTPWAVPVRIKRHEGNEFEWDSRLDTEHSKAIIKRPDVALTIYVAGDAQFGFYAKATANLLRSDEKGFGRYKAVVTQSWINDHTFVKRTVEL